MLDYTTVGDKGKEDSVTHLLTSIVHYYMCIIFPIIYHRAVIVNPHTHSLLSEYAATQMPHT